MSSSGAPHVSLLVLLFHLMATWRLGTATSVNQAEEKLLKKVITNQYTKYVLPIKTAGKPVLVSLDLNLRQIAEVNEVKQTIRLNVWMRIFWNNPLLAWNKSDFENVESITIDKKHIWIPDLILYNEAVAKEDTGILYKRFLTNVVVKHNGDCAWFVPTSLFAQCNIDVTEFPFDEQVCLLTFGSWAYTGDKLNVTYITSEVTLEHYIAHNQWDLFGGQFTRHDVVYQPLMVVYPDVTLKLRIRRLPLYYLLNLIIPSSLISVLSFLSFVLPTSHGERVSLNVTVLLALSVYMLILSTILPHSSKHIPKVGTYFLCITIELAFCLLAACLTMKLDAKETEIPAWCDAIINTHMARLVCFESADPGLQYVVNDVRANVENSTAELSKVTYAATNGCHSVVLSAKENSDNPSPSTYKLAKSNEEKIRTELVVIADHVREMNSREARVSKWKRAAKILDRFFIFTFSLFFFMIGIYFFA